MKTNDATAAHAALDDDRKLSLLRLLLRILVLVFIIFLFFLCHLRW
jgi:hypothetical protein